MKKIQSPFLQIAILALMLLGQGQLVSAQKQQIALEDIWLNGKFRPDFPSEFNWMKDDNFYTELDGTKIEKFGIKDQSKVATILDIATLKNPADGSELQVASYRFSDDESKLLLIGEATPIYRHSTKEACFVWDSKSNKVYRLHEGRPISFATFSPDGSSVAYMADNNLFAYTFATNKESTLSNDGSWGNIINGGTDWVYEEEFAFDKAFAWSPDSKKIAFYRFDESKVREFNMAIYGDLYPKDYKFKYPKAGEANAAVEIHIFDLASHAKVKADVGPEVDQYIPRITWTQSSEKLAVMRMNRLQNQLDVLLVDSKSGSSKVILSEKEDTYIEQPSDNQWFFLKNGKEFLWQSEADGYMHIYLYDLEGKQLRQITKGNFDVSEFCALDEQRGLIYYLSTADGPTEKQLYSVSLDGKKTQRLTKAAGFHGVSFSSNNSYYLDSYSTIDTPPYTGLYDHKGSEIKMLKDNAKLKGVLGQMNISKPEFFSFKTGDGTELNGWMIKPADFDKTNKYPVLMHVYGGPGSQTVKNEYGNSNYIWHQMLAQQGYIVVSVDNRGTGARGEAFKKCTYGQLGKLEAEDQIEAAKYLGTLEYVNKERIGIWGWSFGGYMTSLCLTKGNGIFKMGIAVAPVTTWRFYDTIYTERYLKTPQLNASGYDDNSPIKFAKQLKGSYLLVHGTADDNVHFQNSMAWVDALVSANIPFEMAFYPNKNHGIYGGATRFHLYNRMTQFLKANL
ncbi:MAG: S9 family peptidase [Bacteroidetes bacterium]|nr:S9 family peptidase [Bacteroidota bacterium]MBL0017962.1 S9 family peptidase [Bacteroidota bacterium]MBP6721462.1 S9 family peptidase [Bacteroidia bacterium]